MAAKKPNTETVRAAGLLMEKTYDAFEEAKHVFARVIYDAGNRDWESFWAAMKEALSPDDRAWEGRIKFSEQAARTLFQRIERD